MTEIKLEDRVWKQSKIRDLFKVSKLSGPKKKWVEENPGGIEVVTKFGKKSHLTEGIIGRAQGAPGYKKDGNCILIPIVKTNTIYKVFYREPGEDFMALDNTLIQITLKIDQKLNHQIANFLIPIFDEKLKDYSGASHLTEDVLKEDTIYLPRKENNPDEIDWEFMMEYIDKIDSLLDTVPMEKFKSTPINISEKTKSDFRYEDIFETFEDKVGEGGKSPKPDWVLKNPGTIMAVSAKLHGNGLLGFSTMPDKKDIKNGKLFSGDCLTASGAGSVGFSHYRHSYENFYATGDVKILRLSKKWNGGKMGEEIGLFLVAVMQNQKGDRGERISPDSIIQLPSKELDGNIIPDWNYIKKYIVSMKEN